MRTESSVADFMPVMPSTETKYTKPDEYFSTAGRRTSSVVGAVTRQARQDFITCRGVGIAGHEVGHKACALGGLEIGEALGDAAHQALIPSIAATCGTSLSPRPDRLTTSRLSFGKVGASFSM